MRLLCAALVVASAVISTAAQAEKRTFIIANNADGYGVDRCLASGAKCGAAAAAAYCKSREFAHATSYRQVGKEEITGAVPANSEACNGGSCEHFVAIECAR